LIENIDIFEFPVSLLLGVAVILLLLVFQITKWGNKVIALLTSKWFVIGVIGVSAILIAIDGTWKLNLEHTWPFLLVMLLLMLSVGATVLRRISKKKPSLYEVGFFLTHAGLFFIIWAAFFGAADNKKAKTPVFYGVPFSIGLTEDGEKYSLPFEMELQSFTIDQYDNGMPSQYTSVVAIECMDNDDADTISVSVNHPVSYDGFMIYQDGYDTAKGEYTVLLVVEDDWLWLIYAGFCMLLTGMTIMVLRRGKR